MKTITLRELHTRTGYWIREAAHSGEIQVTDRGKVIAKIVGYNPERGVEDKTEVPYFARRKVSAEFAKAEAEGRFKGGKDITIGISEDREDRDL